MRQAEGGDEKLRIGQSDLNRERFVSRLEYADDDENLQIK